MVEEEQIFKHLEYSCEKFPSNFYWADTNGVILGLNKKVLASIGAINKSDIIGKTVFNIYPPDIANDLWAHAKEVMTHIKEIQREHKIKDMSTGEYRYFSDTMSPITNNDSVVIGVVGTSIEITAEKEAKKLQDKNKQLELENKMHQAKQQQEFKKIVDQVVHDIRSPIATLQMILPHCDALSEQVRLTVNKSVTRIQDIANNLLNRFKLQHDGHTTKLNSKQDASLISSDILDIVTEKRYEYINSLVDFVSKISQAGHFAFINVNIREFKRMLSNLINNAVDAFDHHLSVVTIHVDIVDNKVQIIIEDNGCGMPEAVKEKILNNIIVTSGKLDGHGIGFGQIRDTIVANAGSLAIESTLGQGTQITLTFPLAATPDWMCNKIELKVDDLVIILDDEPSIHGAWDARFKKDAPNITLKHFEQGAEAVEFINSLSSTRKDQIFLLTDYELLKQNLHGLEVVNKTKVTRSILVTSHHNSETVRNLAKESNTKILPKLLASEVKITVADAGPSAKNSFIF